MPRIEQEDLFTNNIAFTKLANLTVTTTVQFLQGNISVTSYTLGLSTAFTISAPLQIHDGVNTSVTGWSEEQDITLYSQSCTTEIPWFDGSSGVVVATTASASITTGDLVGIYGAGTWTASGNLNVARALLGSGGSQNAAFVAGGNSGITSTELFNGSVWAQSSNLIISRSRCFGTGSQNAGIVAGGDTGLTSTELFNGSAWNVSGSLNIARSDSAGAGSQNATLAIGGTFLTSSELFNGLTWSSSGNLIVTRFLCTGAGSQNAGIVAGGDAGVTALSSTELFNGSTWSASGVLSTSRGALINFGSQNAATAAGGSVGLGTNATTTELFNGSAWSISGNLITAKQQSGRAGSQNSGVIAGAGGAGGAVTELHNQTLYRKLTYNNFREAKNIGIATDVVSGATCNVKIVGYLNNATVTSGNATITTAAQWATAGSSGYYIVLSRFSPNVNTTNNPSSILVKSSVEAEDYLVGQVVSQTEFLVFDSNIYAKDNSGIW